MALETFHILSAAGEGGKAHSALQLGSGQASSGQAMVVRKGIPLSLPQGRIDGFLFPNAFDAGQEPFIRIGGKCMYPPPLFSCIEDGRLISLVNVGSLFLMADIQWNQRGQPWFVEDSQKKVLVLWSVAQLEAFITEEMANFVLHEGRSHLAGNPDNEGIIFAVLPCNDGEIRARLEGGITVCLITQSGEFMTKRI